eukprot:IDg20745t1
MQFSFSSAIGLSSANLPPHEMKVLGGRNTLRGYAYGELGRAPSWRTTRLEMRFPLNQIAVKESKASSKTRRADEGKKFESEETGSTADSVPQIPVRLSTGTSLIDRLPSLTPYLFSDSATREAFSSIGSDSSYGVGLRIAGIVNVELARGAHGREPKLNISLVDHRNQS